MPVAALALVGLAFVPRVVVVRDGVHTIMSVQSDLADGWPLPEGTSREGATTVPSTAFDEIDRADAPVLRESWETDPCPAPQTMEYGDYNRAGAKPESVAHVVATPAPPPRSHVSVQTVNDGFRVETSAPTLTVPVVAGQEVVIHVLASSVYEAVGIPSVTFPQTITVPAAVRASFPEVYEALFEHAGRSHPGIVLREFIGYASIGKAALASFGNASTQGVFATRLHVRPAAGVTQIVFTPTRESSHNWTSFDVEHPWPAPIRCVDPERGDVATGPAVPVAPEPTPPPPTADELLSFELPALGLHEARWWNRLPPFDSGVLAGGGLGLCIAVLVRRRSPP